MGRLNSLFKNVFERYRLWELKRFIKKDKFSLLDLGCGDGNFVFLASKFGDVIGVDKNPKSGDKRIIKSDIEKFRIDRQFNIITMYHVLEHLNNPNKMLKRARQWLKADGVLVIETPLVGNLTEKFLSKEYLAYSDPAHKQFFTKKEILKLLEKTKWKVAKQGITWLQFPITVITSSFKSGLVKGFLGVLLFIPLKILSSLKLNDEILRLYCLPL